MAIDILHFIHPWHEDQDFARIMAASRHLTRYGERPLAQSYIHFSAVRRQNLEYMRKAHRRLLTWCRRLARAERRVELPDSPSSSVYAPSTTESDEDDFDYGAVIDRVNQRQVPQPRHNHGRMDQINHGKVISQDKRDPSEYDTGRWLPLIKKVTRDRWTQLAVLVSSKTHTTLAQSNLSVSLAIGESFISQHEQSSQRIFRCI